jgi:hypothetical protein
MELVMLNNVFVEVTKKYKTDASSDAVKEWRKVKGELSGLLETLEEKYDMAVETPDKFKNKISVFNWLVENGWQISKSQFYDHCKLGLIRPVKSGGYPLKTVQKYASLHVKKQETGEKESEWEVKMREEKLKVSLAREQIGLDKDQFELDAKRGKYIPRSEFELAVVSRAVAFMAHLNHTIQANVPLWIQLVNGDSARAPELVEAISREIEQRMGDFAADVEFEIILEQT